MYLGREFWPPTFDAWRPIPRALVSCYCWILYDLHSWFLSLPDPTSTQQVYALGVWGAGAGIFGFYVNSGPRKTSE